MKGALGLVVLAVIIWGFWMSWEWLKNKDNDDKPEDKTDEKSNN